MSVDDAGVAEVSVAEVRRELRRHLEWSEGVGTLAIVLARTPPVLRELRSRVVGMLRRGDRRVTVLSARQASDLAIRQALDGDVVWLDLPFGDVDTRLRVLRALNHARTSLGRSGATLVLTGPVQVATEAATEAADLWSVAALVRSVMAPPVASPVADQVAASMPLRPAELRFAQIYVGPDDRDGSTPAVLATLRSAYRVAADDLTAARAEAANAVSVADRQGAMVALGELARAELAARAGDRAEAAAAGRAALESARGGVGSDVLWALVDLAWVGGDVEVALSAGDRLLEEAHPADDLPARRTLAWLLEDKGLLFMVSAAGIDSAEAYLSQAFRLREEIAAETDVLSDWDALANAMEAAGWVAATYLGDSPTASSYYHQALPVRRNSYAREPTAARRRQLAKTLELVADVEAVSDPESAIGAYTEALSLLEDPAHPSTAASTVELARLRQRLSDLRLELAG